MRRMSEMCNLDRGGRRWYNAAMTDNEVLRPATAALDAQGPISPGTQGWWQVWGARAHNVRPGDLVMLIWGRGTEDERHAEYLIDEILSTDAVAPKFRAANGDIFRIGALMPIILLRQGTHHTLA